MKICPSCSFSNAERFPTCVLCNTILVDVCSTSDADSSSPKRDQIVRSQLRTAATLYVLVITLTAVLPGLIFDPEILLLYFLSSLVVVFTVLRDITGQFSASALQGAFSLILVIYFGPMQAFIFFMLAAHVLIPSVFWHSIDMIHDTQR